MNRQTWIIIGVGIALAGGAAVYVLTRTAPEPAKTMATTEPPSLPPPVPSVLSGRSTAASPPKKLEPARTAGGPASPSTADAPVEAAPTSSAATLGTLHFETDAPGVEVFIDRILVGVAPVTVPNVKPGPHRLNLSLPGYEPVSESIEVAPGPRNYIFKFKEVRLDAKIDVVHKHRLGSCKGTLVASPRVLRYDTADKGDAFSVALMEIQTLEVDYLEKRLRIVIPGGKRFDFTDPDGNADRLFVFHRDVTKARERLKKGELPAPE